MTLLLLLSLACAPDTSLDNGEPSRSTVTFTDAFGVVHVDDQVSVQRWDPVSGSGCDTGREDWMESRSEQRSFTFRAVYNAAGRGVERPERDIESQWWSVAWEYPEEPDVYYKLATSEVRLVAESDAGYELEFTNGSVETKLGGDDPTATPQVDPVTVVVEVLDSSIALWGAVTDGAPGLTVDPETGASICTRPL